jgi:putative transport protein
MYDFVVQTLRQNPELAIFLTIGLGFLFGRFKLGSFTLGAVTGTLIAGILVGQLGIPIGAPLKSTFFMLFLFAVGYGIGPQFVRGIAKDGVPQALFAVLMCVLILVAGVFAAKFAGFDAGFAAGVHAGSQTISASIGLATDAINGLSLSAEQKNALLNHIPVAYAVTYIWGTVGTGLILAKLGPKLLGIDLAAECKRYEQEMGGAGAEVSELSAWRPVEVRAYRLGAGLPAVGKTVAEVEQAAHAQVGGATGRMFIERVRRNGEIIEFGPATTLQAGDMVAISGRRELMTDWLENLADEVDDQELLNMPAESVNVVVTSKQYDGKTLQELSAEPFTRGVFLRKITRGAVAIDIPILPKTVIQRGDILRLIGTQARLDAAIDALGYADRPTEVTDMIWVGLGIAIGGLIGALSVPVHGIPLTLSTSGGALFAGLLIGWLRSVYPTFGQVPAPSLWLMNTVGLNMFIAVVGISSGPTFIAGLMDGGVALFFWGLATTSVPMLLAPLIGKYVFRFDPAINLGCCGGARTSTASVGMVGDEAKSNVPMLGYTVPYAVSNTLLTLWGLVVVNMVA